MKRSIFIATAILLISVGYLSACKEKEDAIKIYSAKEGRFDVNETEFVRMHIAPDSGLIKSTAKLILENQTKGLLSYGKYFSLEYFDKENWVEIQLDINFEDIGLGLSAGEIHEGQFNLLLFEEHNKGKKGRFRFVKNFGVSYNFPYGGIDSSFKLYIEFEIK